MSFRKSALIFFVFISLTMLSGCRDQKGPPPPLAIERIPSEFAKGFAKAKPSVKELSSRVVSALETTNYSAAYESVQNLCAAPEAVQREKELAARALLSITALLQSAQAQGDDNAAEVLKAHKMFK